MADIKKLLEQNIAQYSNKDQLPYAGLTQRVADARGLKHDCSKIAIDALQEILLDVEKDSIEGLETRIKRIGQLEEYISASDVGTEEENILMGLTSTVREAVKKHLKEKRAFLAKASRAIKNSSIDVGGILVGMSKNDPVMRMLVDGGGAVSKKIKNYIQNRNAAKDREKQLLREDASTMYDDTIVAQKKAEAEAQKKAEKKEQQEEKEAERQRKQEEKDATKNTSKKSKGKKTSGKSTKSQGEESTQAEENAQQASQLANDQLDAIGYSLFTIEYTTLEIAETVDKLLQLAEANDIREKNRLFDEQEAASERKKSSELMTASSTLAPGQQATQGGGGLSTMFSNWMSKLFGPRVLAAVARMGMVGGIAAAIIWPILDGISGVFKAKEWGVSNISAFLGGMLGGTFSNKIVNVFANMGKWALVGATLGAPFFGVGAIAGGVVGAVIGAILGVFGGEKIAQFMDTLGTWLGTAFNTVLDWGKQIWDWVSTTTTDVWNGLTSSVGSAIDNAKLVMSSIGTGLTTMFDSLKESIVSVVDWFSGVTTAFWDWLKSVTPDWAKDVVGTAKNLGSLSVQSAKMIAGGAVDLTKSAVGAVGSVTDSVSSYFTPNEAEASIGPTPSLMQASSQTPLPEATPQPIPQIAPTQPREGIKQAPSAPGMKQELLNQLQAAGITDVRAQANIMASVQRESAFKPRSENLNYRPETLMRLWPNRFKTLAQAKAVAAQGPEGIANAIYGNRMGNKAPGDGYKYRGRGLIQLTGRDNYATYGKLIGEDLVNNPELANDPVVASKIALAYFKNKEKRGADLSSIGSVNAAVGFADSGGKEASVRAQLAAKFATELSASQYQTVPTAMANKDLINSKSASMARPIVNVTNVANNVNNVKNGGGGPPSPMQANGTSSAAASWAAAMRK